MNITLNITPEIRFELKRFVVLSSLIAFALVLIVLRSNFMDYYRHYRFMLWNLFLALIPYGISLIMLVISNYKKSKWWNISLLPLGGLWLLFFPNAPYLITTYAHFHNFDFSRPLRVFALAPWYDLVWYSAVIWGGVLAGYVSLEIVHTIVKKFFGKLIAWVSIVIILFLSSWAIYLGRFIRLNSWDITNPSVLLPHILLNRQQLLFVFILGIFMLLVYIFLQIRREK